MLFSSVPIPLVSCNQVPSKAVTSALSRGDLWVVGGFLFTTPPHLIIWALLFVLAFFQLGGFSVDESRLKETSPWLSFDPTGLGQPLSFLLSHRMWLSSTSTSSESLFPFPFSSWKYFHRKYLVCLYFRLDKTDGSEVFLGSSPFPCFLLRRANRPKIVSFSDQK